jgi:type I restriction enzyme R subunit
LYFTILDFRNVTDLFADPDFDGPPIRVKEASKKMICQQLKMKKRKIEEPVIDNVSGEEIIIKKPSIRYPKNDSNTFSREKRPKIYVNGVDVSCSCIKRNVF